MQKFVNNIFKSMIEARQLEANRQIAEMNLSAYAGDELKSLRPVVRRPAAQNINLPQEAINAPC